jgi:hypothetical protein
MYYPYLRGKQFELIALREFADAYDNYKLIPIIEPVKSTFNSMSLALKAMKVKNLPFVLILNPQVGDIIDNGSLIESSLSNELAEREKWFPAFIVTNNNHNKIIAHINDRDYQNVFLICKDNLDTSASSLIQLFQINNVGHIVINADNSRLKRLANKNNKAVIRLDDNFNPQRKNSDYLAVQEEMFTEEYRYYAEDGYCGISDYTVLPSEFIDGGMLPYAIAIHWTYEKSNDAIWVRHFVSDTNDDYSNIQGKFAEAARKAVAFFDSNHITDYAAEELRRYVREGQYPGLGVIKKLSIKNHIELLNNIFTNKI